MVGRAGAPRNVNGSHTRPDAADSACSVSSAFQHKQQEQSLGPGAAINSAETGIIEA